MPAELRPIWAASGNVANAQAQVTLSAGNTFTTTYISGFIISGFGATAAVAVNLTIAGLAAGTMTIPYGVVAGATTPIWQPHNFFTAMPALPNSVIIVTLPAFGAGNTNASLVAYGFQA